MKVVIRHVTKMGTLFVVLNNIYKASFIVLFSTFPCAKVVSFGYQHAIAYVEGDKYFGAKATINVWEPKIQQPNEFSLSQVWVLGGSFGEDLNSIEAGWQVHCLSIWDDLMK